jgi:hypothetical protein
MTTPQAAAQYLREHQYATNGRPNVVWNPHGKPIEELPVIYGFNNGGSPGWMDAVAVAEDGTCLGGHICSHEGYMPADLGVIEGTRPDRHESQYRPHYPDGYRMEFVGYEAIPGHEGLNDAIARAKAKHAKAEEVNP